MRFLCYTLGDPNVELPPPTPELMEEMGRFVEDATKAGALLATGGVGPLETASKVSYDGKQLFEVEDATIPDAGMIGLWTKADSITLFDDLTYGEIK